MSITLTPAEAIVVFALLIVAAWMFTEIMFRAAEYAGRRLYR
jgi:hypothetical protein